MFPINLPLFTFVSTAGCDMHALCMQLLVHTKGFFPSSATCRDPIDFLSWACFVVKAWEGASLRRVAAVCNLLYLVLPIPGQPGPAYKNLEALVVAASFCKALPLTSVTFVPVTPNTAELHASSSQMRDQIQQRLTMGNRYLHRFYFNTFFQAAHRPWTHHQKALHCWSI